MTNEKIKQVAKQRRVKLWRIADALGITDAAFSRKLRYELSAEETAHVLEIIDKLAKEG